MATYTRSITSIIVLLATLTLLVGCSSTRSLRHPANSLDEVNAKLAHRWVRIQLCDGSLLRPQYNVRVDADSVRYDQRGEKQAVSTSEVATIHARRNPGGWCGALLGAAAVPLLVNSSESLERSYVPTAVVVGVLAVPGALIGYMVGSSTMRFDRLVYEGPVEKYLN